MTQWVIHVLIISCIQSSHISYLFDGCLDIFIVLFCFEFFFLIFIALIDPKKLKISLLFLTSKIVLKNETCQWYFVFTVDQLVFLHIL